MQLCIYSEQGAPVASCDISGTLWTAGSNTAFTNARPIKVRASGTGVITSVKVFAEDGSLRSAGLLQRGAGIRVKRGDTIVFLESDIQIVLLGTLSK